MDNFGATATVIVAGATSTAQARLDAAQAFGVDFVLPEGWLAPERLDTNTLYLTDGQARLFIYRGDAAYAEQHWGIPAGVTDLDDAAEAVAKYVRDGEVVPYELERVRLITRAEAEPMAGLIYLFAPEDRATQGGEWLIVSANVPPDQFDTAQRDILDPLIQSLAIVEPLDETAVPQPTMTLVVPTLRPAVSPMPTASAQAVALSTASSLQMTATQMIRDATAMAEVYVTHTPRPPTLTRTPLPSATHTAAFDYGATATVIVQTAAAVAKTSENLPDVTGILPDDWHGPIPASANSVYFTDDTARLYIYHGDAAYFEDIWLIQVGETSLYAAAKAVAGRVDGELVEDTGTAITPDVLPKTVARIDVSGTQTLGAVYVIMRDNGWLIVSASAPPGEFERYAGSVFEPVVELLGNSD